jgi:AcrR family transcriptional regulator
MARPRSNIEPRILRAARKRFLDSGVDGASLRQIARDAGTSIGMIYYYFPTKDDLFLAVVEEIYEVVLRDLAEALNQNGPFETRVLAMYQRVGAFSNLELEVVRLVVREALTSSTRFDRLIERFKRGHLALVLTTAIQGVQSGAVRSDLHPAVIAMITMAVGVMPQFARRVAKTHLPGLDLPENEGFAQSLVEILLRGIGSGANPRAETP